MYAFYSYYFQIFFIIDDVFSLAINKNLLLNGLENSWSKGHFNIYLTIL